MKVVRPSFEIISCVAPSIAASVLESCMRVAYLSTPTRNEPSEEFVKRIIGRGHESTIEHLVVTVKIICDRGVSHELVRHRLASFTQESTRYCNYSSDKFDGEVTFIKPNFRAEESEDTWFESMLAAEGAYLKMIEDGESPQIARSVLPNSLKTTIVITANFREWRHIFSLRCASAAHPQMREVMLPIFKEFKATYPFLFADMDFDEASEDA